MFCVIRLFIFQNTFVMNALFCLQAININHGTDEAGPKFERVVSVFPEIDRLAEEVNAGSGEDDPMFEETILPVDVFDESSGEVESESGEIDFELNTIQGLQSIVHKSRHSYFHILQNIKYK